MAIQTVASVAKRVLTSASSRLGIPDPLSEVSGLIDQTLAYPLRPSRRAPLSPHFNETTPESLSFLLGTEAPGVTADDRVETTTQALRDIAGRNFGTRAAYWVDNRTEPMRSSGYAHQASYGARFGSCFDRDGISESFVQYEWGPQMMESLAAPMFQAVRTAMEALPGLEPSLNTVRCGRTSGSQQVSFTVKRALPLAALQPLMDRFGLGHRHGSLMSATAFVLGARFTLPPDSAQITLRPTRSGMELRIDVNLDALPDAPAQLMALMRLQMTERPRSATGLDRWLMALTPDGFPGPGTVNVLSAWVRPDLPARLALYLRPALFNEESAKAAPPRPAAASLGAVDSLDDWATPQWADLT
jgi:hypothetical protein